MKAVILAAGKGTRMAPLTDSIPKPLLPVAGKPIIEYNIELLEDIVEEIIIVAGYEIDQFKKRYSGRKKIRIVEQEEALGTADAALRVKEYIDDKALILNGDDIYDARIEKVVEEAPSVLASERESPEKYGVYERNGKEVEGIVEKPVDPPSKIVNTGCFSVEKSFFDLLEKVEKSERGELEITDALEKYLEQEAVGLVRAERWLPCSYPWQLIEANEKLMESQTRRIDGEVSDRAELKGNVILEEGAEVKEFTVIEGPTIIKFGATVGPNAYIRGSTVLGKNVHVGNSEIKNSVIGEGSSVPHFSYVGDSYIGEKVNIGAGTKIANLRNDNENIRMEVKNEMMDTGREKLGAIIGSGARIGVNNSIKPGRKIGVEARTDSGEKVGKNLDSGDVLKDGETR